jgi:hypothetical protein
MRARHDQDWLPDTPAFRTAERERQRFNVELSPIGQILHAAAMFAIRSQRGRADQGWDVGNVLSPSATTAPVVPSSKKAARC